jgi:predicted alpha/beta-hydrolase family hydrolase
VSPAPGDGPRGPEELHFAVAAASVEVSARLWRPPEARRLLVLGHGAGAGMEHPFLTSMAARLAGRAVATFRYQFPYMERGHRRPDSRRVLAATVRAAVEAARRAAPDLPLLAGGKSMGGRMTSLAASEAPLPGVGGLVFFGFPLHPPGKESSERAEHLASVNLPMLFLQGTRDKLADLARMRAVTAALGGRATLHVVEGADHGFHVLKRSGRTHEEVLNQMAAVVEGWPATAAAGCGESPPAR